MRSSSSNMLENFSPEIALRQNMVQSDSKAMLAEKTVGQDGSKPTSAIENHV